MKYIRQIIATLLLTTSLTSIAAPEDDIAAANELRTLASEGNSIAQRELGKRYHEGSNGFPKDYKVSMEWYRKAADQGDSIAQTELGWMYQMGEGVPHNAKQAMEWYRKAADKGNADAENQIGLLYHFGYEGAPKDEKQAMEWYRKAADHGSKAGQSNLEAAVERIRIADRNKEVVRFRPTLKVGDETHCGLVIEVKKPIIKVQTMAGEKWLKINQIYRAGSAPCNFVNGVYQEVY